MEIKQKIAQIVDQLPNEVLVELLDYLHTILTEDAEVLDKLSK